MEAGSSGCGANLPIHAEEKKLFMIGEMCSIGFAATGNDEFLCIESLISRQSDQLLRYKVADIWKESLGLKGKLLQVACVYYLLSL